MRTARTYRNVNKSGSWPYANRTLCGVYSSRLWKTSSRTHISGLAMKNKTPHAKSDGWSSEPGRIWCSIYLFNFYSFIQDFGSTLVLLEFFMTQLILNVLPRRFLAGFFITEHFTIWPLQRRLTVCGMNLLIQKEKHTNLTETLQPTIISVIISNAKQSIDSWIDKNMLFNCIITYIVLGCGRLFLFLFTYCPFRVWYFVDVGFWPCIHCLTISCPVAGR